MKARIDKDEWYPVYSIDECGPDCYCHDDDQFDWHKSDEMVEIPDELAARCKRAFMEFQEAQVALGTLYEKKNP